MHYLLRCVRAAAASLIAAIGALAAQSEHALDVDGLPADAPFEVRAFGYPSDLRIVLSFASEWHAYSRDVGGGQPATVTLADGSDFAAAGPVQMPDSDDGKLEGTVDLWVPLARSGDGRTLSADLELQVCDALMCLDPIRLTIRGEIQPLDVLLVVDEVGARSGRIQGWLEERGFAPKVAAYGEVTAAACDAADVVLADSPYFRQYAKGAVGGARAFPRTKSPIVGVGFLATELFEAHELAMTSGYI